MYLVLDREASWWCAGVTLGLMASESSKGLEQWELIADTSSLEEGLGPMQLHAAGSAGGFTALQLVCNRPGSPPPPGNLSCSSHRQSCRPPAAACSGNEDRHQRCQPSMQDLYLQHSEGLPGHQLRL